MKNNSSLVYGLFLVTGDFFALVAAFTSAYILRVKYDPRPLIQQIPAMTFLYAFLAILPIWILINALMGLYRQEVYEKRFSEIGRLIVSSFLGILVFIGYDFVSNETLFPARLVPVYGLVLGFCYLLLFRTLARIIRHMLFRYNIGVSNILLIGDTDATSTIAHNMGNTRVTGIKVIGAIGRRVHKVPYYDTIEEALERLPEKPHGIVQTELYKNQDKNNDIVRYCQLNHVSYRFIPGNSDMFVGNIQVELFADQPVIAVHQTALIGWGKVIKRSFDILSSFFILLITSPIFLILAILQKMFDPRAEIFFKQTRLTRHNNEFQCYKFRTLKPKYNGLLPEEGFTLMGKSDLIAKFRNNGDFLANDPRLTKLGLFMRKTSLDELPQLLNVLKGDISLVGPRALVPRELNAYEKKHAILSVKSGLTGLAQISGRKDITFEERRKLDVYYVQNWSFWMDMTILLRTVRAVISGSGAK